MTNKYESDTRYIFINTQSIDKTQGDQINQIKLNLGTRPIQNDDDSVVKVSLNQFNLPCNWWSVNSHNNTFRVMWKTFTHSGTSIQINDTDSLLKIPVGNYLIHQQLQNAFCAALKTILDASVQGGSATFAVAVIADKTDDYRRSSAGGSGIMKPVDANDLDNRIFGINITCSNSSFVFDNIPAIHSLFLNPSDGLQTLTGGTTLTADEQYNDSAALFGGNRADVFRALTESDANLVTQNSFSIKVDTTNDHVVNVFGFYPMNTALNTLPYVYLRFNTTHNQSTTNYDEGVTNHKGEIIPSHIFAKIERQIFNDGSVFYRYHKDSNEYYTILTSQSIQNLEFSITDHLGRVIPQNSDYTSFLGSSLYADNEQSIITKGNLFCDFTLKVERVHIPFQPNTLQGNPLPLRKNGEFVNNLINIGC